MFKGFLRLFFPETCCGCKRLLIESETILCGHCEYSLPVTNFHTDRRNKAARQFWGRIPLHQVVCYLYFSKGSLVQHLLYEIKYYHTEEAAVYMGIRYGCLLMASNSFEYPDLIVSVPLHPKKYRKRGFNQSDAFARGLSKSLNIPFSDQILGKKQYSNSQTLLGRVERIENNEGMFFVKRPLQDAVTHLLLVDDVLTTGATVEACVNALQVASQGIKISVATLAFTN